MVLRKHSIDSTPFHPSVIALAEQGIDLDTLEACCAEARKAKPNESLSVAYIVKKLEGWKSQAASIDVRGAKQKTKAATAWTLTPQTMSAKARGRKNQAQMAAMAQQQESNIIDNAKRYEEVILNPLLEWMFELDRQFRTEELTVEVLGELGARANLQTIPPQAFGERYFFRWCGTSYQQNLQRMQQMIAWMNVLRGIPPQQLDGRRLNIGPILEYGTEQIFGPEVAPRILIDERNLFHLDPQDENLMMHNGLPAEIHQADDDRAHIAAHLQAAQLTGDPQGLFRAHIQQHQQAMQAKLQAQQAPKPPQGQPGVPGGAGPGVAGTPRAGAQPGQPRPQGPAGMIHPDQIASPMAEPR